MNAMPWPFFLAFLLFGSVAVIGGLCLLLRWALKEWPGDVDSQPECCAEADIPPTAEERA